MAFDQVLLRLADGQEFGPVSMQVLVQWHHEGRVPKDAFLVDADSREVCTVASFPQLVIAPPPMPGNMPVVQGAPSATDHLIPTKNPQALIAYYCGVFGIPLPFLGPVALIQGILGVKKVKTLGVGRTHAIVGIVLGSLETLTLIPIIAMIIYALV